MLFAGTQMHIVTFCFVCLELAILIYLLFYRMIQPDDKAAYLNVILISLLVIYNVTGGLLPDENLPGSVFIQVIIAYGTGFITPCYFPYYVYKAFSLEKMKFNAYKGVYLFFIAPYLLFVLIYGLTGSVEKAKYLFIFPQLFAIWVVISLIKAIRYKYQNNFSSRESKEEMAVLLGSLTPWVGLPFIDFFNLGQAVEATVTNLGFLSMLALQMHRHIRERKAEHQRLIDSEKQLSTWNTSLEKEVEIRTNELEKLNEQRTNTFVNLAHETKTPLTLVNNYLEEYIIKSEPSEELIIVKRNLEKLTADIVNLFDLEKFNRGFAVYNHNLICNLSEMLQDSAILFKQFAAKRNIELSSSIEENIYIKADPFSINRIINNLVENAVKFSKDEGKIEISLQSSGDKIKFIVKDTGIGIPIEMQKKVFEPYYQITNQKSSAQGMGLGLPIVKKVIDDLNGEISITSNTGKNTGTEITVILNTHNLIKQEEVASFDLPRNTIGNVDILNIEDSVHDDDKQSILIVEDNTSLLTYLNKKLSVNYNVYPSVNGNEAISKIKNLPLIPDLIITDVMMDKMDGYSLAKIIAKDPLYTHIPIIFMSAKAGYNDKLFGLKLGAIDYIQKPFQISELLLKIDSILLNAGKQKRAVWDKAFKTIHSKNGTSVKSTSETFEQNCEAYHLTGRQKDIANLICQGHTYKIIGETLFIAERTVTKHAQNIFEKVKVSTKIELINKLQSQKIFTNSHK